MTDSKQKNVQNQALTKASKNAKTPKASKADKNEALFVSKPVNMLLWLLSFALLIAAIGGNFYYAQHYVIDESSLGRLLRVAIVIVTIVVALGVTLFTNKGHKLLSFARESYVELKKVVWPTRPEAVQTTIIVFVAVSVVSLFLYLCDVVFLQIVRAITL